MGNNNFTETFQDGLALTQAELETALRSLTLDVANTTQMTTGSTSGQFLQSNGDGAAASFADLPALTGPNIISNYGLTATAASNTLVVSLKTNNGSDPSAGDTVDIPFTTGGATTATYTTISINSPVSLTLPKMASSTTSTNSFFSSTSTNRLFIYALDNSGSITFGASTNSGYDNATTVTTTAITSSSNVASLLYASASLSVVARLLGAVSVAIDASGNWQSPTAIAISNIIPTSGVFASTNSRPSSSIAPLGGIALSSTSGSFASTSTGFVDITNLSVTLTTSGRPVHVLLSNTGSSSSRVTAASSTGAADSQIKFLSGSSTIFIADVAVTSNSTSADVSVPPSAFQTIYSPVAGTYTFKAQASSGVSTGHTVSVVECFLMAYEI